MSSHRNHHVTNPMGRINTGASLAWRAVGFFVLFAGLQLGWQELRGGAIERLLIHDATVRPAAFLIDTISPGVHVRAVGASLVAPGGGLNILNGCEGIEALFLLTSAFCVVPLPWTKRLLGFLLGVLVTFLVNQGRIVVLFYAYRSDPALFSSLHGFVAPIAVVLLIAGYFHVWVAQEPPRSDPAG